MTVEQIHRIWGHRIRTRRKVTQTEFAVACGTTQATISRIESGDQAPSDALKLRIADVLGEHPDDLFNFDFTRAERNGRAA